MVIIIIFKIQKQSETVSLEVSFLLGFDEDGETSMKTVSFHFHHRREENQN